MQEREADVVAHEELVDSGSLLQGDYASNDSAGQSHHGGYSCKYGEGSFVSVWQQCAWESYEIGHDPESYACKLAECAREKTCRAAAEWAGLHYDARNQSCNEGPDLRKSRAQNQVDEKSNADCQQEICCLIFHLPGRFLVHGVFSTLGFAGLGCNDILHVTPSLTIWLHWSERTNTSQN